MRPRGLPSTAMSKYVLCVTFLGSAALCIVSCGVWNRVRQPRWIDRSMVDCQTSRAPNWTGPIGGRWLYRFIHWATMHLHTLPPHMMFIGGPNPSLQPRTEAHSPTQSLAHLATEARTARRPKTRLLVIMVAAGWSVVFVWAWDGVGRAS